MFHVKFINNKKVIYSDLIPETEHFFTTREYVIRSDEPKLSNIASANYAELCKYFNIDPMFFISPNQAHSDNVRIINPNLQSYPNTDGLITDTSEIVIALHFADCTPVILYDKKHNIGAVVHAGWRGTAAKISAKAVELIKKEYLSSSEDIYAIIGPAIAICCYEVGNNVFEQLKSTIKNIDTYSTEIYNKTYIDLKGINKQQLLEAGLERKHIDVCPYCTSCNNDMFFSHRKEHGTTSRHSAILRLKPLK